MGKIDILTLGAARAYTKATAEGLGWVKGANCTISFTEAIPGGTKVTFEWVGTTGTTEHTSIYVMDGVDGKGIRSVAVDSNSHLIITYDDGTTQDAGKIEVHSAVDSVNGKTGDVTLVLSDVVNIGDGISYDSATNTLSVNQQSVENTVENVLDEEIGGYIEEEIPKNLASESDIEDLFNN